ncbi:MAG: hypothetical protein E7A88_00190 [Dermabacter sp.]|nr:hypothetical protein [Dermabacter sp.]
MDNKKKDGNKNRLKVSKNKVKYFITSTKVSLILAIIFVVILITQRQSDYFPTLLSSNTALLAIFIKIEWDEHKEREKNKYNNQRLILAYYNELKNFQLIFGKNKYQLKAEGADIDTIDKKVKEAELNSKTIDINYYYDIKNEISRGLHNLEILEVRLSNHELLEKSIKNMLLESAMIINESLLKAVWEVQENYYKIYIKPLNYDELREILTKTTVLKDCDNFIIRYENWLKIYNSLRAIDINIKLDEHMERKIKNMTEVIEKNKNHK